MTASGIRRSSLGVLLAILTIIPCQAVVKRATTEDPNNYPGSWYRIVLDANGRSTSGDGYGYEGGTWYVYPETGWYRQWFHNLPFDATGKGHFQLNVHVRAIDSSKLTAFEVNVNWTTPSWSQLNAKQPPLPKDAPTAREESQYMLSRGLYRVDNQTIKPATQSFTFTVDQYCPEWVSVDVRGRNACIYGGVLRQGDTQMDFGDAPDTYQTLLATDAPGIPSSQASAWGEPSMGSPMGNPARRPTATMPTERATKTASHSHRLYRRASRPRSK